MSDQDAATQVYTEAVAVAKAEYDAMEPELTRLQTRALTLKRFIQNGSALIGSIVEDKYGFISPHQPTPHLRKRP